MLTEEKIEEIKNEIYDCHINSYIDDEDFNDHFEEIVTTLSQLDDEIKLYRVVFLEDIKDINKDNLGQFWVIDPDVVKDEFFQNYLQNECNGEEIKGMPFIIEAIFNKDSVDLELNINQYLLNPNEEEITLVNNAKPVSDIKIYDCENNEYKDIKPKKTNKKRMKNR